MTQEIYVDKEIMSLLLKVKCPLRRVIKQDFRPVYYTKDPNDVGWWTCDAYYIPTQAQVIKWLMEEKGVAIIPVISSILDNKKFLWDIKIVVANTGDTYSQGWVYEKLETAYDATIKHCLTKLI